MAKARILWVDDEVDQLQPQFRYLEKHGYEVVGVSNVADAQEKLQEELFDMMLLDQRMPGGDGLSAIRKFRTLRPHLPIVMVTQVDTEEFLDQAWRHAIQGVFYKQEKLSYLLNICKGILEAPKLRQEKTTQEYQQEFRALQMEMMGRLDSEDWIQLYKKLVDWELRLDASQDEAFQEIFTAQRHQAQELFCRFFADSYLDWLHSKDRPLMTPDVLPQLFLPHLEGSKSPVVLLLIDCMRYDQWKIIESLLTGPEGLYHTVEEKMYFSLLPSATQYARNALFAGLFPLDISQRFSRYWADDDEEGGKNLFELEFFQDLLLRHKMPIKVGYHKVITPDDGKALLTNLPTLMQNDVVILIFNFLDLVAHALPQMNLIKELASHERALRATTRSWAQTGHFEQVMRMLPQYSQKIFLTTDHGSIRVKVPLKIIGDRETTANIRYKQGRNLNYDRSERRIFAIRKPHDALLPRAVATSTYAFAMEDCFLVYPNNYHNYVRLFEGSYQHGGISLDELIIPWVELRPKNI
ncbi:MAG: T9SS response regulator signal transducer PorX [Bacteroidia bacterium]